MISAFCSKGIVCQKRTLECKAAASGAFDFSRNLELQNKLEKALPQQAFLFEIPLAGGELNT